MMNLNCDILTFGAKWQCLCPICSFWKPWICPYSIRSMFYCWLFFQPWAYIPMEILSYGSLLQCHWNRNRNWSRKKRIGTGLSQKFGDTLTTILSTNGRHNQIKWWVSMEYNVWRTLPATRFLLSFGSLYISTTVEKPSIQSFQISESQKKCHRIHYDLGADFGYGWKTMNSKFSILLCSVFHRSSVQSDRYLQIHSIKTYDNNGSGR